MQDLFVALFFMGIGLIMILAALEFMRKYEQMEVKGIKTKAKIIDFIAEREKNNHDSRGTTYYFPIVEFLDVDGNKVVQKLDFSEESNRINTFINILYLKQGNEYDILVDKKLWKSTFPQIFIYFGYFSIGVGIILIVRKFELDRFLNF